METMPTSNAAEAESPDTAPSEKSAEQTLPGDDLAAAMTLMSDFELMSVALVANAILHKRAADRGEDVE